MCIFNYKKVYYSCCGEGFVLLEGGIVDVGVLHFLYDDWSSYVCGCVSHECGVMHSEILSFVNRYCSKLWGFTITYNSIIHSNIGGIYYIETDPYGL